jgi:hypothetical protein
LRALNVLGLKAGATRKEIRKASGSFELLGIRISVGYRVA